MINKREFSIQNMKKVLHKHGKQWIVVSAALLMMLGGGAMATKVSHADSTNNAQANVKIAPSDDHKQSTPIVAQAKNLHSQILNNADQKSTTQNQNNVNSAKTETAPAVRVNNGASNLVSLQKLYTLYEDLVASGIFNSDNNNQPVNPNNNPVQPSDNQPSQPSDNQPSDDNNPVQSTLQQMKNRVFSDINNDRAQNGQPALQMNSDLNEIANQRAQQIATNFSHYDPNNNNATYYTEDANSDGINLSDEARTGENIGMRWFSPVNFTSDLGNSVADRTDHNMMYSDAASNWATVITF